MNYQKIYNQIIQRAKSENRTKGAGIYYEAHHIVPKCLGGGNERNNLVLLTSREHYICHALLVEIYPKNKKIVYALHRMLFSKTNKTKRYRPSSRVYEYYRDIFIENVSGENNPMYGSEGGFKNKRHKIESIEKMRIGKIGKPRPDLAEKNKTINSIELQCPNCNFIGKGFGNMKRWHFNNCKIKEYGK